jgi:hypothetical protein
LIGLLAKDSDSMVRAAIASRPLLPADLFDRLAKDSDNSVRFCVASNADASDFAQKVLALDPDLEVQRKLASVARSEAALKVLAMNGDSSVRTTIAARVGVSAAVLDVLADDSTDSVLEAVARNKGASPEALEKVLAHSNYRVQLAVAQHPNAGEKALTRLTNEGFNPRVLVANPAFPTGLFDETAKKLDKSWAEYEIGRNTRLPWTVLRHFSRPMPDQVARYVDHMVRDIDLGAYSPDDLANGLQSGLWCVRLRLLTNSSLSASEKNRYLSSLWQEVEEAIEYRPDNEEALRAISLDDVRQALVGLDLLPPEGDKKAVAAAAKSSDMLVRVGAALSPEIQPSLLRMLLTDPQASVHQLAARRLREVEETVKPTAST